LPTTSEILSFLKPTKHGDIADAAELDSFVQSVSEYTTLTKDFFVKLMTFSANNRVLFMGDWVQVGVWRGGGALFLKALMEEIGVEGRLYLYDTFGQIPVSNVSKPKDRSFVDHFHLREGSGQSSYLGLVQALFERFGLDQDVILTKSDINDRALSVKPTKVSLLHVDVDFFEATLSSLEEFYGQVVPGGFILIDDYFNRLLNCKEAVDLFFEKKDVDLKNNARKFSTFSLLVVKPKM
jgi:hypothetical protein